MRVAFNAQFLQEPKTGTGRYVFNLLSALGRVDGINEYLLLSPHDLATQPETPNSFRWETTPVGVLGKGGENVEKVVWEQRTFPAAAKRANARVAHIPHFAPPLRTLGVPYIVTIHDVIPLRLPEYRATPAVQAYMAVVARAARKAAAVIADSEHCKRDIMDLLGIPASRIKVIRIAPDTRFKPASEAAQAAVRAKYGLGERFVLNVGGLDVRKNLTSLIGAFGVLFHEIDDQSLCLFVAGDAQRLGSSPLFPDWRPLAAQFGVAEKVICRSVDEEDLPALYSAASCFVFTSLYEGFGLTPLEAMACGAPVVCSNRTSLPEVVGIAGIQVDPLDLDDLGDAMYRVLTSREVANDLRERAQAHARQFSWDRVAVDTCSLYADVTGTQHD